MLSNIITIVTDFGLDDPFVGIMKGVMLNINRELRFIDISNNIPPQDVLKGIYVLKYAYPYFPEGTVHLIVIDPGVGTERRAVIAKTKEHIFVAPDNGVLSAVPAGDIEKVVEITEERYMLKGISSTFHGRDIFSPVAAWLSKGEDIKRFGSEISDYKRFDMKEVEKFGSDTVKGEIIYIDHFGNLITNIHRDLLQKGGRTTITIDEVKIDGIKNTYAASRGSPSALINSWGLLEIFIPNGNASLTLNIGIGREVLLTITGG